LTRPGSNDNACTPAKKEQAMMKRADFEKVMATMLHRQPFRPFLIELDDGERLVVGQREAVHHYVGSAVYFRPDGNFDFVDPENVNRLLELEVVEPK
jgi:hypothetical protein